MDVRSLRALSLAFLTVFVIVTAGTGSGDFGKMHYRAGLNQIPLIEW